MPQSPPLTVGIELIDDPSWMGGTLYLQNLAVCLSRLPEGDRPGIRLLGSPATVATFLDQRGPLPGVNGAPQGWWQRLRRRLSPPAPAAIDVVYPGFGAEVPGAVTLRWIPDFQHRHLPHLFSAEEIAARDVAIGAIAARPQVVVLSSETARQDFAQFFPDHRAEPRVWHFHSLLSVGDLDVEALRQTYSLPDKYLYLPNQFWAHKNHLTVFKALALLRERGLVVPLVCTGATRDRRNENHFASLMNFVETHDLADQIHLLGLIDRADQVGILRCAAAIVQPSLFEGWSTIVEDVRAIGRPIFLSDLAVHREQDPPHGTFFSPDSPEQLATLIAQRWDTLSPGPDSAAETQAQQFNQSLIIKSAYAFASILRDAVSLT